MNTVLANDGYAKMKDIYGMLFHCIDELLTGIRCEIVISIQEECIFSRSLFDACLTCEMQAKILRVLNKRDTRIISCCLLDNISRIISACIVYYNGFKIGVCLCQNTVKTLLEVIAYVIGRDDNRNFRHCIPCLNPKLSKV